MMKVDYEACKDYVQNVLHLDLFNYQWMMLKAFCDGIEVRTARGVGRTYVANAFGKYIAYLYGRNNYYAPPQIRFGYECAIGQGLYDEEHIKRAKNNLSESDFRKEYLCVSGDD